MTDSLGTVMSASAFIMFMIFPGARLRSASAPITNPGVSTKVRTGMLKESQSTRKLVIFSQASVSSAPPLTSGLLATMPTQRPSSRARPVTATLPKRAFNSKKLPLSTMVRTMVRTS